MPSTVNLEMPYGDGNVDFCVPSANLRGVYEPQAIGTVPDVAAEIRRALANPIDCPTLDQLAHHATRVVVVADDNTRLTPTAAIVPIILDALNEAGIPDDAISVLVALGTHRAMTERELEQKFGKQVRRRIRVVNHDAFDPDALVDLGTTPSGVSVQVSRRVMEADLVVGVGSIVPHHIPGFSGGAKIIQPGVCGERTTGDVHLLSVRRERSLLGVLENRVRHEMESIAERAGLRAILNTVLDRRGRLVGAVYGDPKTAFRQGVEISRRVYGVRVNDQCDVVIAGSHPCDAEFWQAHKTLYPAERCVCQGGTIIVVTPCREGIATTHPQLPGFASLPLHEIDAAIRSGEIQDRTAGALAWAWANVRQRATIALVSDGIDDEQTRQLGFAPYPSVQDALDAALERHGGNATICVLPYAPDTLPLLD